MRFEKLFSVLGILLLLFIALPIVKILLSVAPGDLFATMKEAEVRGAIALTLRASLWATLAALFSGVPLGYLLARREFRGKRILEGLIDLPVIIPHTAAGIALLSMWGRQSWFSKVSGIQVMGTEFAISMGMFFVSVPYLINSVKDGFSLIDPRYEKTAVTLGATPLKSFLTIGLPLVKKSIFSGSLLMWGRGISEFGAVVVLAYHPMTAPVLIFERFQNFGLKYALPVAALLIIISLTVFVLMRLWSKR